jgi:hypothetical protein
VLQARIHNPDPGVGTIHKGAVEKDVGHRARYAPNSAPEVYGPARVIQLRAPTARPELLFAKREPARTLKAGRLSAD